ncbi:MAG: hypothetical protein ABIO44_03980 [Saprospiraceae bacterium]
MKNLKYAFFWLLFILSCKFDKLPDIRKIKADVHFYRFDDDLFALDSNHIKEEVNSLILKYPTLSRIYFQDIMQFTKNIDSMDVNFYTNVKLILSDPLLISIHHRVDSMYGDMSDLKLSFDKTYAYAKYYFPKMSPVNVYTFISAFNVGNIIFSESDSLDGLGISLDFFQGSDFNYKQINPEYELFANYLTRSFNRDHLLKKTWMPWLEDVVPANNLNSLLDQMIYEGKKLYILSKIIPDIQDTILHEFTPDQMKWCDENKLNIWSFLKDKNLVNSTKRNEIARYINPSPTSSGMPKESPGRAAVFIGYDIVRSYLEKFPNKGIKDLVKEESAQKILDDSRYKPLNK